MAVLCKLVENLMINVKLTINYLFTNDCTSDCLKKNINIYTVIHYRPTNICSHITELITH